VATGIRKSRTHGTPPICAGSTVMRSKFFIASLPLSQLPPFLQTRCPRARRSIRTKAQPSFLSLPRFLNHASQLVRSNRTNFLEPRLGPQWHKSAMATIRSFGFRRRRFTRLTHARAADFQVSQPHFWLASLADQRFGHLHNQLNWFSSRHATDSPKAGAPAQSVVHEPAWPFRRRS
jgi:hypothetical protein